MGEVPAMIAVHTRSKRLGSTNSSSESQDSRKKIYCFAQVNVKRLPVPGRMSIMGAYEREIAYVCSKLPPKGTGVEKGRTPHPALSLYVAEIAQSVSAGPLTGVAGCTPSAAATILRATGAATVPPCPPSATKTQTA